MNEQTNPKPGTDPDFVEEHDEVQSPALEVPEGGGGVERRVERAGGAVERHRERP